MTLDSYKSIIFMTLLLLVICSLVGPMVAVRAQDDLDDRQQKRVLFLNSYHKGYKWSDDIAEGIQSVFEGQGPELVEGQSLELVEGQSVELQIEYMDTKWIFDEPYLQQLYEMYAYKFSDRQFDVLVSSDDNAFNFLVKYRDELFPGTPVVFCGVNFFDSSMLVGQRLFTGVNEDADLRGGLELALQLHPGTKQVVIVNDTTTTGVRLHGRLVRIIERYPDIEFTWLEDVTMGEVRETVSALPPDSLIFYTLFFRDKAGNFFEYDNSVALIAEKSAVPMYGVWDFSLGYGIVGGKLTSGYAQGEAAGEIALRILQGEHVQDIPIQMQSPSRYMFDYEQLERFGIELSDLPEDSIVINRTLSFYERYRTQILVVGGSIAFLTFVIVLLFVNVFRRRRAERELVDSNRELQTLSASLEQRVQARTAELAQRAVQLQAASEVARATTSMLEVDALLREVVGLVRERFDLYYVGLFIIDKARQFAVLRAGTGEAGRQMLAEGHQLKVGGDSMIGQCVARSEARIALDVGEEAVRFDNPCLPETHSELALPLRSRGQVVGAMTVQSIESAAFDEADIAVMQTVADHVAIAIDNARLFAETQAALQEAKETQKRYLGRAWAEYMQVAPISGYETSLEGVAPLGDAVMAEIKEAVARQSAIVLNAPVTAGDGDEGSRDDSALVVPITMRGGESIGALGLHDRDKTRQWTEEEIALTEAVAERLALAAESLRSLDETQRREARERLMREITDKMRRAADMDELMQTTIREMSAVLGASAAFVQLGSPPKSASDGNGKHGDAARAR
jgi:GAF domain-containing protein